MRSAAAILAVFFVLGGFLPLLAAPPARAASADWTLLVYMDADNNLEDYGIADFLEMAGVGSTSRVNIVAQFDRAAGYNSQNGDWTDTKRFLVQAGVTPPSRAAASGIREAAEADPARHANFSRRGPG